MAVAKAKEARRVKGALYQSLNRNNKDILKDRAETIGEDLEMTFKRGVENIEVKLKRLNRDRASMYDLSPTNTQTLILAKDLDAQLIENDNKMSIEIRQLEINLEIANERYLHLFVKQQKNYNMEIHLIQQVIDLVVACLLVIQPKVLMTFYTKQTPHVTCEMNPSGVTIRESRDSVNIYVYSNYCCF
jgi:hypothetical protein